MSDRGVIYMVWGRSERLEKALERSRKSVAAFHPELPVEVFRLDARDPAEGLLQKARMFELSPFRETLFLDADTVLLDRVDYGFQKADKFGLACCICECPWARRYPSHQGDTIEYNTGVLFFSERAKPVFESWARLAPKLDSSVTYVNEKGQGRQMYNDQCSFAAAIEETGFSPFVLPLNWNFRPHWYRSFFGPIKIWHEYTEVPPFFDEMRKYYDRPDAIIQYHGAK